MAGPTFTNISSVLTTDSVVRTTYYLPPALNGTNGSEVVIPRSYQPPSEVLAALFIQKNYLKIICAVGLPGNLAAVVTMATVRPRTVAVFLVVLLAISDSAALVVKLALNQLYLSLDRFNDDFCRSRVLANVCSSFANWVLVVMALERLIAVLAPMARSSLMGKSRVYFLAVFLLLLIFSIHAPLMFGSLVAPGMRFRCTETDAVSGYSQGWWPWLNTVFYALLPIVALFFVNAALCVSLWRAGRRRQRLMKECLSCSQTVAQAARRTRRSERAITAMVLVASFLLMVLVLPQCLFFILFYHTDVYSAMQYKVTEKLLRQVTTLLADSTHALNFYVYVVSVRQFRRRFLACLRCQGRWRWSTTVSLRSYGTQVTSLRQPETPSASGGKTTCFNGDKV